MRLIVDCCYLLALCAAAPLLAYRALRTGKYRGGWAQRRGYAPTLPPVPRRVWFHAVSVGEVNAARGIIDQWRRQSPQTELVVSCTTDTGLARARALFPELVVFRYPLDLSRWVRRAMDRVKPTMIVLVELEVWYQFVTQAAARGIPVAVINGRLSATSLRRFRKVGRLVRPMFAALEWVGAQDETYAGRFRQLGVPPERVTVTGSLKWDTAELADAIPGADALAAALGIDRAGRLWVCGSTGPGEEQVVLEAYGHLLGRHPDLQLAIIPRKPERFDEVAGHIRAAGYACVRRSEHRDPGRPAAWGGRRVILGDTMGELRAFYSLATVVFAGRSLANMGGSDMMEVAALCRPIVVGPHTDNFGDTMDRLRRGGGVLEIGADLDSPDAAGQLAEAVDGLLRDPDAAAGMARNARAVVQANRGATGRTLTRLMEILERAQHPAA